MVLPSPATRGLSYSLRVISPLTLHSSFLRLAIRIHICFVGTLSEAFPQRLPLAFYLFTICKKWRQYYTFTLFLRHCLQQQIRLTTSLNKPYRIKSTHGGEEGRNFPCRESIGYRQLWIKSLYGLSKAFNINSCF